MQQANINITLRETNGKVNVLDIDGDVTSFAESALMDAYKRGEANGARIFILNFSGLEYMNSSGIGLLVTLLVRTNRQQHRLFAVGLKEHYRNIFELTRLNEAIQIFDTEAEALVEAQKLSQETSPT